MKNLIVSSVGIFAAFAANNVMAMPSGEEMLKRYRKDQAAARASRIIQTPKPTVWRSDWSAPTLFWGKAEDTLTCVTGYYKGGDRNSRLGKTALPGTKLHYTSRAQPVAIVALPRHSKIKKNNRPYGTAVVFTTKSGGLIVGVNVDCGSAVDDGKAARLRGRTVAEKQAMTVDVSAPRSFWKNLPDFTVAKVFRWNYPIPFNKLSPEQRKRVIASAIQLVEPHAPAIQLAIR